LNHILSDFDADLVHIGDVLVVTPTAATYDEHISNGTPNASAQTITITADNYNKETGRLTLNTTIYILASMFDNTNSAKIDVTLRNKNIGSKIVSDMSYIYCYSFALAPEEHQPSGTCNFSRIDSADLHLGLNTAKNARVQR
jgi:Large eukaryotic DNA virus major capsid protein.